MEIGNKIRSLRLEKGYSQDYVAKTLGMSQNNYSKIELGEIKLTVERLKEIAKVLETDIFSLLDGEKFTFYSHNQSGGTASSMVLNNYYADKLLEYLENQIVELKKEIEEKDKYIKQLTSKIG